jgi:hypothetical protein
LLGGVVGPDRFRSIIDRHLGQPGPSRRLAQRERMRSLTM